MKAAPIIISLNCNHISVPSVCVCVCLSKQAQTFLGWTPPFPPKTTCRQQNEGDSEFFLQPDKQSFLLPAGEWADTL